MQLHYQEFFLFYLILIPLLFNISVEVFSFLKSGILWLCVLFSFISERLYQEDFDDGCLELYFFNTWCLQWIFSIKLIWFWIQKLSTVLIYFPLIMILYNLPAKFCILLVIATLGISLVVAIYSCLTSGIQSWLSLQHLMILPSVLPILLICNLGHLYALICLVVFKIGIFWLFISINIKTLLKK